MINIAINIIKNLLLGMLPDVLFFTYFLIYTKNLKEKRLKLFVCIMLAYLILVMISQYKILYYILFTVLVYLILKSLYRDKTQITDIFMFGIGTSYITLLSCISFKLFNEDLSNYYYLYTIDRLLLIIPFLYRDKFNSIYKKYLSLWNRNDIPNKPIKSITLRNITLISINSIIFIMNIYLSSIIEFIGKGG